MRDSDLKKLRPSINSILTGQEVSEAEQFQNDTLRPILNLQNELLLSVFRNYLQLRKNPFDGLKPPKRRAFIEKSVRNDLKFRNFLMGLVAGHFTLQEWEIFEKHSAELTRRTVGMLVERLHGQLEKLG